MVTGMGGRHASFVVTGTRFSVRWVAETGSTNTDLLAEARAGAPDGLVLVADHQTAGRGRLDRRWEAPPDAALLGSVLLRPELAPAALHLVTAAVALAAREAVGTLTGVATSLKWPNDLVVPAAGDRKLAGVLAESIVEGDAITAVVVGIGLNVRWGDALVGELAEIATSLDRCGARVPERRELLEVLLAGLEQRLSMLDTPDLVAEYRAACGTIGRRVRVTLGDEVVEGLARTVTDDGALAVHTDAGERVIVAGDVTHVRTAD